MIVGLAVGIPIAIITIVIIVYVCYKRKQKVEEDHVDKDVESNIVFGNAVNTAQKEVQMELDLPDGSSDDANAKVTQKD